MFPFTNNLGLNMCMGLLNDTNNKRKMEEMEQKYKEKAKKLEEKLEESLKKNRN